MFILVLSLAFSSFISVDSMKFSAILRNGGRLKSKSTTADPYGWELQSNPVSKYSCYSLEEKSTTPVTTVFDRKCVGFDRSDSKCRGGFPFYRFSGGSADCVDCLDSSRCQMMCLSKGMDAAAVILDRGTRNPIECRCGATRKNLPVWSMLRAASRDGHINFGPVHGLLPPTVNSALSVDDPRCSMFVYTYTDQREEDGGVPPQFMETGTADDYYIRSIVSGMEDPGDVEDSTVAEMERVNLGMKKRLELWQKKNPTGRVPRDEIFVQQVPPVILSDSPASCKGIDEPFSCFDSAIDSVLASNGWLKQSSSDGTFTPEYMTAMMTVSFENWQTLFGAGSDKVAIGQKNYGKSGFCSSINNAKNCPITCGTCKLYDRASSRASMYETWVATNKDSKTGIVAIPYMFDSSNQFVTPTIRDLVRNATAIWAGVTCINFQEISQAPQNQRYILITADVDGSGNPSGCLADPVGLALDAAHPTRINVGGCQQNKKPLGSIVHEFGHVLGLVHTQMRPDRDKYISMNPAMVKAGFEQNFFLSPYAFDGDEGVYSGYDYGSIMHYTRTQAANAGLYQASSADFSGTFKVLQSLAAGVVLGQRDQLSLLDIAEVNSIYQCGAVLASGSSPPSATNTTPPSPATTPSTPSVVPAAGPESNNTKPWSDWESDVEAIADAISAVLKSTDINLSDQQIDILSNLTSQEKSVYNLADQTLTFGKVQAGWRLSVVTVAKTVLLMVAEARRGITLFNLGRNPEQEGILDFTSIDNLMTIVNRTKTVYQKIDSYLQTLPGYIPTSDVDDLLAETAEHAMLVFS